MTDYDVSSQTKYGAAPYFVFCDHASNAIPADLNSLGIPRDILQTHIAWDVGAGALAHEIAKDLGGLYFGSVFSRLIIDPNRAITVNDLIPASSDQIPIPGNQMLTDADIRQRIEHFHNPYHQQLKAVLDENYGSQNPPFVICVHSFTDRLMGAAVDRPWHVGMLWREDEPSARASIAYLEENTDWTIGDNEPYDARVFNYSIERHIAPRQLPHITLEVRQDLLADHRGIAETGLILTDMIRHITAPAVEKRGTL